MSEDNFDALFTLEDQYFDEGYKQGYADGVRQSQAEAKLFGIEQGFKKFVTTGELQAKAKFWATAGTTSHLESVQGQSRLHKHIETLEALVNPATLSFENSDDAVSDLDDRLNRAKAKAKVLEKLVGISAADQNAASRSRDAGGDQPTSSQNIEDFRGR